METLERALELLLARAQAVRETEFVPLDEALGRVTAEDVASPMAVPPFDRSPLDGYCLRSEDIAGASREHPAVLEVVGEACAGCGERFTVRPGQALRVMTGAPIADGCDCVVRQEDTDEGMTKVSVYAGVARHKNICWAGEDVHPGEMVVRAGERLTPAHLGVLSSVGVAQVRVVRRVRVCLLCTGDELMQPGQPLPFGRIYDANRTALTARLAELGVRANVLTSEADDPERVAAALREAVSGADLILTTGGVSVGKKDIFHQVLPLMGAERLFWQVAMKPGSPLLCGVYQGKLMICLSGNPFASLACFEVFARPVLCRLSGMAEYGCRRVRARLRGGFDKASPGRRLIRARFDGAVVCLTGSNHSSGSLSTMIGCNCLIDIPAGSGALQDGDEVEILLL
ncbi:MAG: gephyrin-like molybdotransferase Glp [Candidatus Ventricola sp.]